MRHNYEQAQWNSVSSKVRPFVSAILRDEIGTLSVTIAQVGTREYQCDVRMEILELDVLKTNSKTVKYTGRAFSIEDLSRDGFNFAKREACAMARQLLDAGYLRAMHSINLERRSHAGQDKIQSQLNLLNQLYFNWQDTMDNLTESRFDCPRRIFVA